MFVGGVVGPEGGADVKQPHQRLGSQAVAGLHHGAVGDVLALPGFLLLLSAGLTRWKGRGLTVTAGALWVASGLLSLAPELRGSPVIAKGSDRMVARLLGPQIGPADAVVALAV